MFIQKAIEALLSDRDMRRAAHAEVKATCEQVLEEIKALPEGGGGGGGGGGAEKAASSSPSTASVPGTPESGASTSVLPELTRPAGRYLPVERIFVPFELACGASRSPRLVASALDSIQKLVAYGHIRYTDVKRYNVQRTGRFLWVPVTGVSII